MKLFMLLALGLNLLIADSITSFTVVDESKVKKGETVDLAIGYIATKKHKLKLKAYDEDTNNELSPTFSATDVNHVSYDIPSDAESSIKLHLGLVEDGVEVDNREVVLSIFSGTKSCLDYYLAGVRTDGYYEIDPDESGSVNKVDVYCDMTNGGWTKFEYMIDGWDMHPGDMSTKITDRVLSNKQELYLALASISDSQKFDVAKGQSEDNYDYYQFRRKDGTVIYHPDSHGTHCSNTRTWGEHGRTIIYHSGEIIQINKDPNRAFWYTRYDTDCSVNAGDGAYINNTIWFK